MKAVLGFALGVITVGVLLIAYGVLGARSQAAAPVWATGEEAQYQAVRALLASERVDPRAYGFAGDPSIRTPVTAATPVSYEVRQPRVVQAYDAPPAPRRTVAARAERSGRNWKKTALVIGGSSAAGAGLGAIFGGKKGALIGAAIGGGAGTVYEVGQK